MSEPTVREIAAGEYAVTESRAFVAAFVQTVEAGGIRPLSITCPRDASPPRIELRRGAGPRLDLLQVPQVGVFIGDYRVMVTRASPTPDTIRLATTIANNAANTATDDWELRARHPLLSSWRLVIADTSTTTRLAFLACDPVARIDRPASSDERGSVELVAADATGLGAARTVIGTLPPAWGPCYSWSSDGAVELGLPQCRTEPHLVVATPDIPESRTVRLTVRSTFGGVCPDNTSFLQSTGDPFDMLVVHRDPPPTIAAATPDRIEAGQVVGVTVTGANFLPGAVFSVPGGGVSVAVLELVPSSAQLQLTLDPDAPAGPRGVGVATVGGAVERAGMLTVLPQPRITGITPVTIRQGSTTATHAMTITGQGLDSTASVTVGNRRTVVTAGGAGRIDLTVRIAGSPMPLPVNPPTVWIGRRGLEDMLVVATLADGRQLTVTGTFDRLRWTPKGEPPLD